MTSYALFVLGFLFMGIVVCACVSRYYDYKTAHEENE